MQRLVGATCMAFCQPVLHAQFERDNMIFSTNGNWKSGYSFVSMWILITTDRLNIVNKGNSGNPSVATFIRSPALLAKSHQKGNNQYKKQILEVMDTGRSQ
jgi:hypothetical protein